MEACGVAAAIMEKIMVLAGKYAMVYWISARNKPSFYLRKKICIAFPPTFDFQTKSKSFMFKIFFPLLLCLLGYGAQAALVPFVSLESNPSENKKETFISKETIEKVKGKKLNLMERIQLKMLNKKLKKGKIAGIFPERDDLTEGFRALPFFGTILTVGLLALIMLFTARDRNALNWAFTGVSIIGIVLTILSFIALISA
jgi:hypothetical protein